MLLILRGLVQGTGLESYVGRLIPWRVEAELNLQTFYGSETAGHLRGSMARVLEKEIASEVSAKYSLGGINPDYYGYGKITL